jgi:hypothetical protein
MIRSAVRVYMSVKLDRMIGQGILGLEDIKETAFPGMIVVDNSDTEFPRGTYHLTQMSPTQDGIGMLGTYKRYFSDSFGEMPVYPEVKVYDYPSS